MEKIQKISEEAKKLKDKYDDLDDRTKKKILWGIVAGAGFIGGLIAIRKIMRKKK